MIAPADYLRAAILGVVQAITEFLPISSSGHLVLAPEVVGDDVSSLTFDVALHLGTMLAVVGYFWRDWVTIAAAALRDATRHGARVSRWSLHARLGAWIALGTVPAVVAGLLFQDVIEERLRDPVVVASMLIVFALVILAFDTAGGRARQLFDVGPTHAVVVGVAQAMALVPGVSRSGVTIAAARGLGVDRPAAARFSFLLSAPVIFGAGVLEMYRAASGDVEVLWGPMFVGALVSAALGALVIRGFLAFLTSHTLRVFVWYRIALGLAILAAVAAGAI